MNSQQQEKVGQLMLWLSKEVPDLYITKLLKLLYLCDEVAVKETGVPITWLKYHVWQYGPVPVVIYDDLNFKDAASFGAYVQGEVEQADWAKNEKVQLKIIPVGAFVREVFSLQEARVINNVIKKYGQKSAKELVNLLHQEDTLWHKIYTQKDLEKRFSLPECYTSPYEIDLSELLVGDEQKLGQYEAMEEFQAFVEAF